MCKDIMIEDVKLLWKNGAWIAEDTIIGENVKILPGAILGRPPISTKALTRKADRDVLSPLEIGDNCVIGSNTVIYRGTTIGSNCLFGDTACIREMVQIGDSCIIAMGVTINYETIIGSRVKVMDNTHLTGNMLIEDDVFIGMLVSTANDNTMGRKTAKEEPTVSRQWYGPIIRRHATIGQGACLLPNIEIGENSIVGSNSVVTKTMPARVLIIGTPARIARDLHKDEIK